MRAGLGVAAVPWAAGFLQRWSLCSCCRCHLHRTHPTHLHCRHLPLLQYVAGMLRFALKARLSPAAHASFAHWHAFLGKMTFFLGMQNCLAGLYGYQMCQTDAGQPFYASSTLLFSGIGLMLLLETVVAAYLLFVVPDTTVADALGVVPCSGGGSSTATDLSQYGKVGGKGELAAPV